MSVAPHLRPVPMTPAPERAPSNRNASSDVDERYRALVEGITDYAILMLDRNGIVGSWNAGGQRILGYAPDEIIGRSFTTFYPQDALDAGWPAHELRMACMTG